ncbi:MAG: hypothetical protein AAGI72_13800 [Pseudomonadota bacterium]
MYLARSVLVIVLISACLASQAETPASGRSSLPELVPVGSRGWFSTKPPFAAFDPDSAHVDIWTPDSGDEAPVLVYAHGGAGYRDDDRARVAMFRRNGFATISFDAYAMNGLDDWEFVSRRVTNSGKQNLIWGVFKGAVEYAIHSDAWDSRNIFLYGGSNGGRVVLFAGSEISNENIRGIVSEAPAATGFTLRDYSTPTLVPFGKLDTWAGKSETDFVWTRTYPGSGPSVADWVEALREKGRPIELRLYENAGHLFFDGPLEKVTVKRGDTVLFQAFKGAGEGVLERYERDVFSFVQSHSVR